MSKAANSIKRGLTRAIAQQQVKARGVTVIRLPADNAKAPSPRTRNIGKEIIEGFEALKELRKGNVHGVKVIRGSGNVFADIGFPPEEAENLKLRSNLMMRIEDYYRKSGQTPAAMAKVLGLTTPRFNALLKGKIQLFSLDALVNIAHRAGLRVDMRVKKAA